jgi:pseudouridine synthase
MRSVEPSKVRLQKYMALCGIASRRRSELMIASGKVSINGEIVKQPYIMVDPISDEVLVDGKKISEKRQKVYILLNKPRGVLTTLDDPFGRKTVMSLIDPNIRVYPVGRLDFDTEGLLILTNDGELTFKLTHPGKEVEKEYYAQVLGRLDSDKVKLLRRGVDIGGYITAPAMIEELRADGKLTTYKVIVKEGKKRQIRKMFEAVGHRVIYLKRERIGNLSLGDLKPGQWRYLSPSELENLKNSVGGN